MNSEMFMNSLGFGVIFFVFGWIFIVKSDVFFVDIKLGVFIFVVSIKEDILLKIWVLMVIQIGLEKVWREGVVSGINFIVNYRDLNCLGILGLLYVMDMYYKNELYVFFGLLCIFVIFVVVCYFLYWGIFVIIFGVWVEGFKDKEEY